MKKDKPKPKKNDYKLKIKGSFNEVIKASVKEEKPNK